jgi:transcription elongation GreA/GreB family factor
VIKPAQDIGAGLLGESADAAPSIGGASQGDRGPSTGISVGDHVILFFADDRRRIAVRLSNDANDLDRGLLSVSSPLGRAIAGAEEGDEVDIELDGRGRKVLIEAVDKSPATSVLKGANVDASPVMPVEVERGAPAE